ncbi:MAG: penicillin acylase family protein, partial [Pirellulaceae bacterium]|nr:penicillin acylase family protein [Pirellulaceae bacterium]
ALLASDPHLEVNRLPAIWYESILKWGDDFVMGATLPGCPLFAVARTPRLAWGVTYMKGDTIDYFVEQCRRGGETGWQYRRGDEWLDFTRRDESLSRKGGEPDAMGVWSNEQGTLDSDPEELGEGYHLSLAWTGSSPGNGEAIAAWLNVVGSADAVTAMNVVRESCVQPTLCWVFADDGGHIGLQASGRFPRRGGGHTGLTPIPAWEEENHWAGWLPNSVLPRIYDPEEGFLATANQEMNPPDGPLLVTQPLPDYRIRRIVERLSELPAATTSDMEDLQYDVVSLQARDLLEVFLPHMVDGPLKKTLSDWDHRYEPTSREASLFSELYRNVMVQILGSRRAIGFRRMLYLCSRAGFSVMLLTAADRELAKAESRWWAGADKGELIRAAAEPIDVERTMPWSKVNSFHFTDRFFGSHQVGRMLGYNSRKFPMPGCFATPFQGHVLQTATRESTFAPSYHFVTDMSTDEAWTNLPGGASENRFSKYYKSDLARWLSGEYKQLAPLDEPAANQD